MQRIAATLAVAFGLLAGAASTASADTTYPNGVSKYTTSAEGWADSGTSCTLLVLPSALCSVANEHVDGLGQPPGAIATRYSTAVNALTLANGTGTWTSPAFAITGDKLEGVQLRYDRRADIRALLDIGGSATARVELVDVTANPAKVVAAVEEDLSGGVTFGSSTQPFQSRTQSFPGSVLTAGNQHVLRITTRFSSILQAALGSQQVLYDNVGAVVADGTTTGKVPPVVDTLPATDIKPDAATLNGTVDPRGTQTDEVAFELRDTTTGDVGTFPVPGVGDGVGPVAVSKAVTGLKQCTTYEVTLKARNARNAEGEFVRGATIPFATDCRPGVETLPAGPISATTASLNGAVNPNGRATAYRYAYGTAQNALTSQTPLRMLEAGREGRAPLSEPISGLKPQTVYFAQLFATNDLGTTAGQVVSFTTPPLTGPAGPAGPQGTPGRNGANGTSGSSTTVGNGDSRALLRIRSALVKVGTAGRRAGQIRFPIYCRKATGRTCAGTVKLRTLGKINPSSRPGVRKAPRRVTLATFEYQLAAGKKGFAISQMDPEKVDLMRRLGRVAISISVQVTDAGGNRQTVVRSGAMRAQRTV